MQSKLFLLRCLRICYEFEMQSVKKCVFECVYYHNLNDMALFLVYAGKVFCATTEIISDET